MKFKYIHIVLIFSISICVNSVFGQAVRNTDFDVEHAGGVNFNTSGGLIAGFFYRHTVRQTSTRLKFYELEIVNVKNPKEQKLYNSSTGNSFIYGKQNYLFSLRPSYGLDFLLFTKGKDDGIQVDALIGGGPTLGIVKPYIIEYYVDTLYSVYQQFDPVKHDIGFIIGSGGFYRGWDALRFVPGIHAKTSITFEFGAYSGAVSGIEVGFLADLYAKKVTIFNPKAYVPAPNYQFLKTLFVNIYFGSRE